MMDYEQGTRQCASGHIDLISEFGTDVSRPDALSVYCFKCCRALRQRHRMGHPLGATEPDLAKSQAVVERERHKRRVEKQIEIDLRQPEVETASGKSVFLSLGFFMRRPKGGASGWSCPTGCASS